MSVLSFVRKILLVSMGAVMVTRYSSVIAMFTSYDTVNFDR